MDYKEDKKTNKSRAKIIGINSCIDALGREYFFKNKENSIVCYGTTTNNELMCIAGIGHIKQKFGVADEFEKKIICYVNLKTGKVRF